MRSKRTGAAGSGDSWREVRAQRRAASRQASLAYRIRFTELLEDPKLLTKRKGSGRGNQGRLVDVTGIEPVPPLLAKPESRFQQLPRSF